MSALAAPFSETKINKHKTTLMRTNLRQHSDYHPSNSKLDFPLMLLNNNFSFLCSSLNQDVVVLDVVVDVVVTAVVDVDVAVEARRTRRPGRLFFISRVNQEHYQALWA